MVQLGPRSYDWGKVRDLGVHLRAARPVAAGRRSAAVTALINLGAARPDRRAVLQLLCVKLDVKPVSYTHLTLPTTPYV